MRKRQEIRKESEWERERERRRKKEINIKRKKVKEREKSVKEGYRKGEGGAIWHSQDGSGKVLVQIHL